MGGEFLDNDDRYIGCSKPACYLCNQYISNHPGRYSPPPSHQKLYLAWRLPDIGLKEPRAALRYEQQQKILRKMIEKVRDDLEEDINNRLGRRNNHADSTAGGTSTVYPVVPKLEFSLEHLTLKEVLNICQPAHGTVDRSYTVLTPTTTPANRDSFSSERFVRCDIDGGLDNNDGGVRI